MSRTTAIKVGLISLGCPKNLVDSELMLGALSRDGMELVADLRLADVTGVDWTDADELAALPPAGVAPAGGELHH